MTGIVWNTVNVYTGTRHNNDGNKYQNGKMNVYIISHTRSLDIVMTEGKLIMTDVVTVFVSVSMKCNRSVFIFRSDFWNCFCFFRMIREVVVELGMTVNFGF